MGGGVRFTRSPLAFALRRTGGSGSANARRRPHGGGAGFDFPSGDVSSSRPDGAGWFAAGQNNGTVAQNLTVYVLCVL